MLNYGNIGFVIINIILLTFVYSGVRTFFTIKHKSMLVISLGAVALLVTNIAIWLLLFVYSTQPGFTVQIGYAMILERVQLIILPIFATGLIWYLNYSYKALTIHKNMLINRLDESNPV